ncbi:MAG: methylated-DNA--[protein]-cysteine S-methyltransferase [Candidatus Coatesbacteria bacterium]|nr:methylated-DNA--[protein]-cysteine S-methyltransferase [Candidatus Coatesbacteria bacterium]
MPKTRYSFYPWPSPVGLLILISSPLGLKRIIFASAMPDWYSQISLYADEDQRPLNSTIRSLRSYFFDKNDKGLRKLKLDISGTPFQMSVWKKLIEIPYGSIRTYAAIAKNIGHPDSARAVGNAIGRNPVPIIIPCHRVIKSDGSLGGFICDVKMKRILLEKEGILIRK